VTPDELITAARAELEIIDEIAGAARKAVADHVARETGERILTNPPSVLDATLADLTAIESRCRSLIEALRLIRQWILPHDPCRLGDRMKVIPAEVAEEITAHLIRAGLLSEGE
jgi:hypothetical protein